MKKKILCTIFLFLFAYGFEKTILGMELNRADYITYLITLAGISLYLLYLIPFILGVKYLSAKLDISRKVFVVAFICGVFIAPVFSSYANELLDKLWSHFMSAKSLEKWSDALTAPFSEEIIKAIAALFALSLFKLNTGKDYLLAGLGSGIGFQFIEDIYYVLPNGSSMKALGNIFPQVLDRLSGSLGSHWTYTATVLVGLYLIIKGGKKLKGTVFMLAPVALHFAWNSPLSGSEEEYSLSDPILTTLTLGLFIMALTEIIHMEKKTKETVDIAPPSSVLDYRFADTAEDEQDRCSAVEIQAVHVREKI